MKPKKINDTCYVYPLDGDNVYITKWPYAKSWHIMELISGKTTSGYKTRAEAMKAFREQYQGGT